MNIFIYSDESGVFDKAHNHFFVFGGLIFLSKEEKDNYTRMYSHTEKIIREKESIQSNQEVKATTVSNSSKAKLFRSVNHAYKFGIVIHQEKVKDSIFSSKKTKQRYLDWAYKFAVRKQFESMISAGLIDSNEVENLYFFVDQHSTATDGVYELRESLETEFRLGNYNFEYMVYHAPVFRNVKSVSVKYCDSKDVILVRAADIVANKLYHMAVNDDYSSAKGRNFHIVHHPY